MKIIAPISRYEALVQLDDKELKLITGESYSSALIAAILKGERNNTELTLSDKYKAFQTVKGIPYELAKLKKALTEVLQEVDTALLKFKT